ncbi:MAG: hypothetical protein SVO01_00405 [Thermotogota bacterium]|nr:hypothetical protein [Thermotogota bacterium]
MMKIEEKVEKRFFPPLKIYTLRWGGKTCQVKTDPEGQVKVRATLQAVMDMEGISKAMSTNRAIETYPIIAQAAELIISKINDN